jgi:hypothetical protein
MDRRVELEMGSRFTEEVNRRLEAAKETEIREQVDYRCASRCQKQVQQAADSFGQAGLILLAKMDDPGTDVCIIARALVTLRNTRREALASMAHALNGPLDVLEYQVQQVESARVYKNKNQEAAFLRNLKEKLTELRMIWEVKRTDLSEAMIKGLQELGLPTEPPMPPRQAASSPNPTPPPKTPTSEDKEYVTIRNVASGSA